MPLEGHWGRLNTPVRQLTRRERRIVAAAVAFVLAAAVAIVLVALSSSATPTPSGCIDTIVPGVMGGQPVRACGPRARAICREHLRGTDPGSHAIEAGCRRAGLSVVG